VIIGNQGVTYQTFSSGEFKSGGGGAISVRRYVWTSRLFYITGLVMLLGAFVMIAISAVAGTTNRNIETQMVSTRGMLQAVGLLITGGLFHVAGAIAAMTERCPMDGTRAEPGAPPDAARMSASRDE
jgi:hypothetical protein